MSVRAKGVWEVWRPVPGPDGAGGQTATMTRLRVERGDLRELTGRELVEALQAGAEHTHTGRFRQQADIRRNDELRGYGLTVLVLTVRPTFPGPPFELSVTGRSIEAGD